MHLPMLLQQAREHVIARFRPILNEHGVTEQQRRIVRVLLERGPLEPREIVRAYCISSPSLAGILARMDELGLVRRSPVDGDRRRVRISPTPKSRTLAARIAPQVEAAHREIEAAVGARFIAELYRTLDQLVEALAEPRR